MSFSEYRGNINSLKNEDVQKALRRTEFDEGVANDAFYPSGNEQSSASLTNLASDGYPLQVGDGYSANNEAYILSLIHISEPTRPY